MKRGCAVTILISHLFVLLLPVFALAQTISLPAIEKGVPVSLAEYRQKILSGVHYALHFTIPAARENKIPASESIAFDMKKAATVVIDFKEAADHLHSISVNGKFIPVDFRDEH